MPKYQRLLKLQGTLTVRALITRVFGIPKKLRVCRQHSTINARSPETRRPRTRSEAGKVIRRAEVLSLVTHMELSGLFLAYPHGERGAGGGERGMCSFLRLDWHPIGCQPVSCGHSSVILTPSRGCCLLSHAKPEKQTQNQLRKNYNDISFLSREPPGYDCGELYLHATAAAATSKTAPKPS
jgi:hypothetical protein